MSARSSDDRSRSQVFEAAQVEAFHQDAERQPFIDHTQSINQPRWAKKTRTSIFNKVMAAVNIALGFTLAISIGLFAHESSRCASQSATQFAQPYSPAMDAIIPIIKKFEPESRFQVGESDELEQAWQEILPPNNGIVTLNEEESAKLAKTSHAPIQSESELERHLYGISMYQQLRCLNTIRKSFHREKFYTGMTDDMFEHQRNDCFDFLRQAIQCHGDVSMMYLSDQDGSSSETNSPVAPDLAARVGGSLFWDVEHSCRALAPIEQWVAEHQSGERYEIKI